MTTLFTVTEENLETGLRGIPVGYCRTSSVDPQKGLFYCGHPIAELAGWPSEKVIYLLQTGKEGTAAEIEHFTDQLKEHANLSDAVISHIFNLPREGHPMDLFSAAILIVKMFEGTGDYQKDCLNLIAKIPLIAACVINHHSGWEKGIDSDPSLGYMENFSRMVKVPNCNQEQLGDVLKLFNILHYDHGGGNLSAFVGKCVASGLQDLYGSVAAAMSALAGPRHGLANQLTLNFLQRMQADLAGDLTEKGVRSALEKMVEKKELIYGFGHAVLRVEDPRATVQYALAKEKFSDNSLVQLALLVRQVGPQVLQEKLHVACPYPNVDAISGSLLTAAGFAYPEYYTVLFGVSRSVGIALQVVYERLLARGGKGTPIVRPKYIYRP